MPIFEYQCNDCRKKFEELTSGRDANAKVTCPACGRDNTNKLLSTFATSSSSSQPSSLPCGQTSCDSGFS